jgi:hypothetical protein
VLRSALAAALAGLCALPAAASAGQRQESLLQDDNLLLYRGDAVADRTFDELRDLGVDRVRLSLPWRALAPAFRSARRPRAIRYDERDFHPWDHALRAARARGIDVLLNVTGGAPLWATGRRRGRPVSRQCKPDPAEFGRFVAMVGRRYDGRGHPRVTAWSIWNEPNFGAFLQPQWERGRATSPRIYRGLVRAALRGLRASGHGNDLVLLGETSPVGAEQRGSITPMRPARFLRELLCLDGDLLPADRPGCDFTARGRFDVTGYAHHPYPVVSPPEEGAPHPDDIKLADRDRLTAILDAAAGQGRVPPELPLWYTEFGWQTPPDPVRGIPLADHAAWLARAEHLTFLDDRVAALTQFQLRDDPPRRALGPSSPRYWGTYQAGLRFAGGTRKPAYDAYRLALDAPARVPPGERLRLWGFVRAAPNGESQRVQLEHRAPGTGGWVAAGAPVDVHDPRGYFEVEPADPRSGSWRFVWRGMASNAVGVFVG